MDRGEAALGVELEWSALGTVALRSGRLRMPEPPSRPGVFRIDFPSAEGPRLTFVGQAEQLSRCFRGYENPATRQGVDRRLASMLTQSVDGGTAPDVRVAIAGTLTLGGGTHELDMRNRYQRLLAAAAAAVAADLSGMSLLDW